MCMLGVRVEQGWAGLRAVCPLLPLDWPAEPAEKLTMEVDWHCAARGRATHQLQVLACD